jgi:molecular chaperone DnaK
MKLSYAGMQEFIERYATNVSEGGLFIRTKTPKPVGTPLAFKIDLANGQRVLQGTGTVKWVKETADAAGPAGMGIEFRELDEASRGIVKLLLSHGQKSAPAPAPTREKAPAPKALVPVPPPPAAPLDDEDEPLGAALATTEAPPAAIDIDLDALVHDSMPPTPLFDPFAALEQPATPAAPPAFEFEFEGLEPPPAPRVESKPPPNPKPLTTPSHGTPKGTPARGVAAAPPSAAPKTPAASVLPAVTRSEAPKPPAPPPVVSQGVVKAASIEAMTFLPPQDLAKLAQATGPIIGIDLGTTNSCVAIVSNGKPQILRSKDGYNTLPSIVALNQQNKLLVGHRARSQQVLNPTQTVVGAKRLVGRDFDNPTVEQVRERFHYQIVAGKNGKAAVRFGDRILALEEVQALILKECKELAEQRLEQPISRAVITCPAYYSEQQREAVRQAGQLAGLKVERVLNEPTAAALAYGMNRELARTALVYDLGGGTFDATVLKIEKNVFEVLATGGDVFLGGSDFDNQIVDFLVTKFVDAHGILFSTDSVALSRIAEAAERAKQALSERTSTEVHVPMLMMDGDKPLDLRHTFTRQELDGICGDLVTRSIDVVRDVLLDAKVKPKDVNDIILVGGQSRMPMVREKLQGFFGRPPQAAVNADEAVALGAALLAGTIDKVSSVTLIDVVPMTIGVGLPGGGFKRIIERNSPLPVTVNFGVTTKRDNDDFVELLLFQGEDANATANEFLGQIRIDGIPKAAKGAVQVAVTVKLDSNSVLNVEAREFKTRRAFKAQLATRFTSEEVRAKLGVTEKKVSVAESNRAQELAKRGGRFWGFLKRVVGVK